MEAYDFLVAMLGIGYHGKLPILLAVLAEMLGPHSSQMLCKEKRFFYDQT